MRIHYLPKGLLIFSLFVLHFNSLRAQRDTVITTPKGSMVKAEKWSNKQYNCHGYAWHMHGNN